MADQDGEFEQNQDDVTDDDQNEYQSGEMLDQGDEQDEDDSENGEADDEVVITIGEEAPPHEEDEKVAPKWVKDLRKRERELARENRELKAAQVAKAEPAPTLWEEPTLEGCDFDSDRFKADYRDWLTRKQQADSEAAKKQKDAEDTAKEFQSKVDAYKSASKELKVSGFADAEAVVSEHFSPMQQGIMFDAVSTPTAQAQLVSALGRNETELKRLASIKNPIKFAVALSDLEKKLTVKSRNAPPAPERVVRGSAAAVGVNDPKLARLEAEADKSGDRSKLVAYKIALKAKAAA